MFVYFDIKGKQYIAKKGDVVKDCPRVSGNIGDILYIDTVLGVNDMIGSPAGKYIEGAKVELKIVKQGLSKKMKIVKFRPQKRHEKWKGFRRKYTDLEIVDIFWSK